MILVEKEFDVNQIIDLPTNTIRHKVDAYTVILAPSYPNWIVLDDDELYLYTCLEKGMTIIQSMDNYVLTKYCEDEEAIDRMTSLISKIDDTSFYKGTESVMEDQIENIPKLIHINLTNNCNLRCAHCYMSAGKSPEIKINSDKVVEIINKINKVNGTSDIVISGGEPFMFPDLIHLLKRISNNKITLFTNGTLINESNYKLICKYCNEVQISFEGISEYNYEQIRGKGNYKKTRKTIELLKSEGIRIIIAVTLLPMMIDDVRENLPKFVKELNYNNLEIRLNNEIELTGNAVSMNLTKYNKHFSDKVIMDLMKKIKEFGVTADFQGQKNVRFKNCGIGTNIVINYDGNIYPCHKFNTPLYYDINTDIDTIYKEFNTLNNKTSIDFIKKCNTCELKYVCSGGCRIDNYNINGDMTIPICNEEYKEKQYQKLVYEYLRG